MPYARVPQLVLALLLLAALACQAATPTALFPAPTPEPPASTPPPAATSAAPVASSPPARPTALPDDTGWRPLAEGVEGRFVRVRAEGAAGEVWLVRVDGPAQARLAVAYAPDRPRRVQAWWQAEQPAALFALNAGFFERDYRTTALLVADGTVYGRSYQGMGGMLAVSGGRAQVRWLRDQPLQPGEQFEQAVQGWPMLLGSAGQPAYTETDEAVAARTAVGQDRAGRLILLVCPNSFFTLHGLTEWLAGSDLDLDTAFNLDGGPSTGLWIDPAASAAQLDSFGAVPAVILLRR